MPQLRDSGTRSLHATEPVPSAEMDGFCRIFGVETEYGVAVTGAERPVDAGQVAMTMFQPIVSRSRSTNTIWPMAHVCIWTIRPEYTTRSARPARGPGPGPRRRTRDAQPSPEGPAQAARILRRTRHDPCVQKQRRLRRPRLRLPETTWSAASCRWRPSNTSCCRSSSPASCTPVPHDPGRLPDRPARNFLDEAVSSATTRSRPMVNTRDEPHADPDSFRRLHVIIGDSNRSQWSTWMKLAVTHLVLCAMEDAFRHGVPSGFSSPLLIRLPPIARSVDSLTIRAPN